MCVGHWGTSTASHEHITLPSPEISKSRGGRPTTPPVPEPTRWSRDRKWWGDLGAGEAGSKGREDLRRNAFPPPAVEHILVFLTQKEHIQWEDYKFKLSSLQPSLSCSPEKQHGLSSLPSLFSLGMLQKPAAEKKQPKLTQKMQRRCTGGREERQQSWRIKTTRLTCRMSSHHFLLGFSGSTEERAHVWPDCHRAFRNRARRVFPGPLPPCARNWQDIDLTILKKDAPLGMREHFQTHSLTLSRGEGSSPRDFRLDERENDYLDLSMECHCPLRLSLY